MLVLRNLVILCSAILLLGAIAGRAEYEDGKYPPHDALIRLQEDLYSRGGCSSNAGWQARLDRRYKARFDAVDAAIVARYGEREAHREVLFVGACHKYWTERPSRQAFERELSDWEDMLHLSRTTRTAATSERAQAKPILAPNFAKLVTSRGNKLADADRILKDCRTDADQVLCKLVTPKYLGFEVIDSDVTTSLNGNFQGATIMLRQANFWEVRDQITEVLGPPTAGGGSQYLGGSRWTQGEGEWAERGYRAQVAILCIVETKPLRGQIYLTFAVPQGDDEDTTFIWPGNPRKTPPNLTLGLPSLRLNKYKPVPLDDLGRPVPHCAK